MRSTQEARLAPLAKEMMTYATEHAANRGSMLGYSVLGILLAESRLIRIRIPATEQSCCPYRQAALVNRADNSRNTLERQHLQFKKGPGTRCQRTRHSTKGGHDPTNRGKVAHVDVDLPDSQHKPNPKQVTRRLSVHG